MTQLRASEEDLPSDGIAYVADLLQTARVSLGLARKYGRNDGIRECRTAVEKMINTLGVEPPIEAEKSEVAEAVRKMHIDVLKNVLEILPKERIPQ